MVFEMVQSQITQEILFSPNMVIKKKTSENKGRVKEISSCSKNTTAALTQFYIDKYVRTENPLKFLRKQKKKIIQRAVET